MSVHTCNFRDGMYFYGGDNFKLLELKPTFHVLASKFNHTDEGNW